MKKNGEYVGVDDKFIPEDEKYVDESLLGNKEETKTKVKKAAKIGIGVYIGISIFALAIVVAIIIFIFSTFRNVTKMQDRVTDFGNKVQEEILNQQRQNEDSKLNQEQSQDEDEDESFNKMFELYNKMIYDM